VGGRIALLDEPDKIERRQQDERAPHQFAEGGIDEFFGVTSANGSLERRIGLLEFFVPALGEFSICVIGSHVVWQFKVLLLERSRFSQGEERTDPEEGQHGKDVGICKVGSLMRSFYLLFDFFGLNRLVTAVHVQVWSSQQKRVLKWLVEDLTK
jgi:hypothetical protein